MAGFGLAPIKREGELLSYEDGKQVDPKDYKPSKTRWIEMCYDPDEDLSHIDLEPFREVFQTQQMCNSYTEDDIYLIIKALANEFIEEGGC
jgi:hypothetical protein